MPQVNRNILIDIASFDMNYLISIAKEDKIFLIIPGRERLWVCGTPCSTGLGLAGQPAERIELSVGDLAGNDGDGDRPAGDRLALGEARDQRAGPPARSGGENKG